MYSIFYLLTGNYNLKDQAKLKPACSIVACALWSFAVQGSATFVYHRKEDVAPFVALGAKLTIQYSTKPIPPLKTRHKQARYETVYSDIYDGEYART